MRAVLRSSFLLLLLLVALAGCGDSSLDRLNRVVSIPDPSVDETPPEAPFAPGQRRDVADADASFAPPEWNDHVQGVVMPGDLDGDGIDDLLVWGVLQNEADIVPCHMGCPGFDQLSVHVIYGSASIGAGAALRADAVVRSWHVSGLRVSVDAAGDVNGDGFADFVVGVGTWLENAQGNAFVVHGGRRLRGVLDVREVGEMLRETGSTHFDQVAGLGDIDGDGWDDFAVGAVQWPTPAEERGRLYVYYGTPEGGLRQSERDASASIEQHASVRFGVARAVGDVDGDGLADFVVTSERVGENTGPWWLVRGRASRLSGELDVVEIGTRIDAGSVRGLGDLDGDGMDELGVTTVGDLRSVVIWGRTLFPETIDPSAPDTWVDASGPGSPLTPRDLISAGDVDGDGHADLFYADSAYVAAGALRGAVYLFRGPLAREQGALAIDESTAFLGRDWESVHDGSRTGYDALGRAVASGSDLNGDGIDDVVLAGLKAAWSGRAYVWLGRRAE